MKLKHLLFFVFVMWFGAFVNAQSTAPYNHLIITEFRDNSPSAGYVEITNKGTETINLSEFEMGEMTPWGDLPWIATAPERQLGRLPNKTLAPGQSWVVSQVYDFGPYMWTIDPLHYNERYVTPEMATLSDLVLHRAEENGVPGLDSVTPNWQFLGLMNWGRDCVFLRHHFTNPVTLEADSMVVDQVNGIFSEADGTMADGWNAVAGVDDASYTRILIRRNYVTTGVTEFSSADANTEAAAMQFVNNRGTGLDDSEWMPIPFLEGTEGNWGAQDRAAFWTVGNSVDVKIDANTLTPKAGSKVTVDLAGGTITVPWGIRNDDSIMYQFNRKPGLAWHYDYSIEREDSAYTSIRTGDKLTLYACGDKLTVKEFNLVVNDPILSENRVIPKNSYDYILLKYPNRTSPFNGMRVSEGANTMDTISRLDYGTRVDSLFKYLEKAPKAGWKIVFKSGVEKPDLVSGDILRVTSENGIVKDYYIKLAKFLPSPDAYLGSITWPDMPADFKGDVAGAYGWKGDTIPGFAPLGFNYVVKWPVEFKEIPALVYHKQDLNSKVVVTRAKSLAGSVADRTVTFTVTAEDGIKKNVYTVRFDPEKDPENLQPFFAEPFLSRWLFKEMWVNAWLQIYNPGTGPLDMSNYMIASGYGDPIDVFNNATSPDSWAEAYSRYIPGKKWQDEADWRTIPGIAIPDLATNAIVQPGEVFVAADWWADWGLDTGGLTDTPFRPDIDIDFSHNPWGRGVAEINAVDFNLDMTWCMWKIMNDSVKNGTKPATDINDFKLIETLGTGAEMGTISFGGVPVPDVQSIERKPSIYKGNPAVMGSNGTNEETNEWLPATNSQYWIALGFPEWGDSWYRLATGIGSHTMDEITFYKSTVSSTVYKVSPGYSEKETIRGLITGVTVSGFYANIIKANPLQTLKVMSAGVEVPAANAVKNGDVLVVLSADSVNTSKYLLSVTANGLNSDALLTSAKYTVAASGSTGVIGGFDAGTALRTVVANIKVPAGATLTVIDGQGAYVPMEMLNYDTAYVSVTVNENIYFSVVAENGTTEIVYQLIPTVSESDAFVLSDVYGVVQKELLVQYVPRGTRVSAFMSNLVPSTGATMKIVNKMGQERMDGDVADDDKVVVTSKDGSVTKTYYISKLATDAVPETLYLAYILSNVYAVDQVVYTVAGVSGAETVSAFLTKVSPSAGASVTVVDKAGTVKINGDINGGDRVKVTSADGKMVVYYDFSSLTSARNFESNNIELYPNPTNGELNVSGVKAGQRIQVYNSVGAVIRDINVQNSIERISLRNQPAGMYMIVVSDDNKMLGRYKVMKQ